MASLLKGNDLKLPPVPQGCCGQSLAYTELYDLLIIMAW